MVIKRRKKSSRQYGTHGWGRNKHRKSGSRGGFGMAGTGKKADTKKPSIWKTDYFGKKGFHSKKKTISITIREVNKQLPRWLSEKKAKEENGTISVDLGKLGYDKLIGTGIITRKANIKIAKASTGAAEKIKAAHGELTVNQ